MIQKISAQAYKILFTLNYGTFTKMKWPLQRGVNSCNISLKIVYTATYLSYKYYLSNKWKVTALYGLE